MVHLSITLLGPFQAFLDGRPITSFKTDKVRALLAYLAVEADRPHRRETLAALLWPGWPESYARSSLRSALANLRACIGDHEAQPPYLLISRETIQFNAQSDHSLDVAALMEEPGVDRLREGIALYRGDLLEGFTVGDSPTFEEWATLRREQLRKRALDVLCRLAEHDLERGDPEGATAYARRSLELEPWDEGTHRQLMCALAAQGQRSAALAQYRDCCRLLAEGLGVEPSSETTTLYESIHQGTFVGRPPLSSRPELGGGQPSVRGQPSVGLSPTELGREEGLPLAAPRATEEQLLPRLSNLPAQATPFVSREALVEEVVRGLRDPGCRLLSLVGPGGSGKTRLALESAERLLPEGDDLFADGVFWVSLAPLQAVESIVPHIASAIGFPFHRGDLRPAEEQLREHLRPKAMLLLLDNYEHLLEGAGLVAGFLEAAPRLRVLVTSRARLGLQAEQLLPVSGMDVPASPAEEERDSEEEGRRRVSEYSSVRLFLQGARRIRPGYAPTPEELSSIAGICRQVHGLPLGILLAAAWMEILSPAEIAVEIGRGLDFLESEAPDLPERQRSLRASFEHSWRFLGPREQEILSALSVFRGSFSREAAHAVAGASLRDLRALADRSLLQGVAGGRYEVHELLRQYAGEKLEQSPGAAREVRERHAEHYVAMLQRWGARIHGAAPGLRGQTLDEDEKALAGIEPEIEDTRAAWSWVVARRDATRIERAIGGLCRYYERRVRFEEGKTACELAIGALAGGEQPEASREGSPIGPRALSLAVAWKAVFEWGMFEFSAGLETLQRSLALHRELDDRPGMARDLLHLGLVSHLSGRGGRQAQRWLEESLAICGELGERAAIATVLIGLGYTAAEEGRPEGAGALVREGLAILEEAAEPALNIAFFLGAVLIAEGHFGEAQAWLEQALEHGGEMDTDIAGLTYREFGLALMHRGLYPQARAAFEQSADLCGKSHSDWDTARALHRLGDVALAEGACAEAVEYYERSIPLLRRSGGISLHGLGGPALAELKLGHAGRARELFREDLRLAAAADYPSWWAEALGTVAWWLAVQGQVERAVGVHALATRQPPLSASRWWYDVVGQPIAAAADTLPAEVVAAAQARGRARDPQATLLELIAEMEG